MSTSATIAYRLPDGERWKGVYQHCDGMDMAAEMRAFLLRQGRQHGVDRGPQALRDLIDATPQGFSAFNAHGRLAGVDNQPYGAYRPGAPDTTEYGRRLFMSGWHDYTCILELDGTVTELGRGE